MGSAQQCGASAKKFGVTKPHQVIKPATKSSTWAERSRGIVELDPIVAGSNPVKLKILRVVRFTAKKARLSHVYQVGMMNLLLPFRL